MRKGYLIFTSHDGDEIDAIFTEDKELFDRLCSDEVDNNDKAMDIWTEHQNDHDGIYKNKSRFSAQAPGKYKWPFNDIKILGTYYLQVY